jgi:uncharacterized protein (TIGR00645 family)
MQTILDKAILASRYVLVVFYLGLAVALLVYAFRFVLKLWDFAAKVIVSDDVDHLIALLHLLDSALVAALVVVVALSSYDSLVSQLARGNEERSTRWVAKTDPGNLKIKLATALIAISSIHLLQIFMEVENYSDRGVIWALAIHGMFLLGALVLGAVDRLTTADRPDKSGGEGTKL